MKKFLSLFIAILLIVSLFATSAIAFADGEDIAVTGISFVKSNQSYEVGARTFNVSATVTPDNATEKGVIYAMAESSKDKGVSVDENSGKVTVTKDAEVGTYEIIATAKATVSDATPITATFTLTLTEKHSVDYNKDLFKQEVIDKEHSAFNVAMDKNFMFKDEWFNNSATVKSIFPGIFYQVEADNEGLEEGADKIYDKDAEYDTIYVEYCKPGESPARDEWSSCKITSTFSLETEGYWSFRFVIKDHNGTETLATSDYFTRYAKDTKHPIIELSTSMKNKVDSGLVAGEGYTPSTSLDVTDNNSSSVKVTYVISKLVRKGSTVNIYDKATEKYTSTKLDEDKFVVIYDSSNSWVHKDYTEFVSSSGKITPSKSEITTEKIYKITYSAIDSNGYFGISGEPEEGQEYVEAHPEMLLSVVAPKDSDDGTNSVQVWKIVLYVIAGLSAVGIVVLLCIKPKQATDTVRTAGKKDSTEESTDNNSEENK